MARAHLTKALRNGAGALITAVNIYVYEEGTNTPISETLYRSANGTMAYANPYYNAQGVIDFYLAGPKRVDLHIVSTEGAIFDFSGVDVLTTKDAGFAVLDDDTPLPYRSKINVKGTGFTLEDDEPGDQTILTLSGGGGPSIPDGPVDSVTRTDADTSPDVRGNTNNVNFPDLTAEFTISKAGYADTDVSIRLTSGSGYGEFEIFGAAPSAAFVSGVLRLTIPGGSNQSNLALIAVIGTDEYQILDAGSPNANQVAVFDLPAPAEAGPAPLGTLENPIPIGGAYAYNANGDLVRISVDATNHLVVTPEA